MTYQITTHVLDLVQGTPAKHIPAVLEKLDNPDSWKTIGNGTTNDDGRIDNILNEFFGFCFQNCCYGYTKIQYALV